MNQRPTIKSFIREYLCGKFLLINTVIFLMMSLESGSLLMPTTEIILKYGAKESLHLIAGEWWRLITPIFVHIGLIHFLFNSYAIYILGLQLEPLVGKRWIAIIYILSGLCGNVSSALFTIGISAGASSSIFGLLGCGLVLERAIGRHIEAKTGRKTRRGMYTSLVVINLILGFMIPAIDNAAHIGGLLGGIFLTYAMLMIMPNNLQKRHIMRGAVTLMLLSVVVGAGAYFSCSSSFAAQRFEEMGDNSQDYPDFAITFYSRALIANPKNLRLHLKRARILVDGEQYELAVKDLKMAMEDPEIMQEVTHYLQSLKEQGRSPEYQYLIKHLDLESI